jgi:alcohol dehydrogenase class IV
MLPHAIRFNLDAVPDEMARIGAALGDRDDPAGAASALVSRLGLPAQLSECGVEADDLEAIVRLSESSPNVQLNPKAVSPQDVRALLEAAF